MKSSDWRVIASLLNVCALADIAAPARPLFRPAGQAVFSSFCPNERGVEKREKAQDFGTDWQTRRLTKSESLELVATDSLDYRRRS